MNVGRGWLCLAAAVLLGAACGRAPRAGDWTAKAARHHAEIDRLLDGGDRPGARRRLASILAEAPARPDELQRALIQDAYFRLAELDLAERAPAEAIAAADVALALGGGRDVFAANLLVVRAAAHEALGHAEAALADYHRALVINDALLAATLHPVPPAAPSR